MINGQIYSATGGLYHVHTAEGSYACRPRGLFRKKELTPYVGDYVMVDPAEKMTGTIVEIKERKNYLIRPAVANIDHMVLLVSTTDPEPNYVVLDKFLVTLASHHIPSTIVVSKPDLASADAVVDKYRKVGYDTFVVDNNTGEGAQELEDYLGETLCVFAGNTGTGKSSLLNVLDPSFEIEVGETSKKLGRGRHTTRHVEIYTLKSGLRVADTPGFSTIDVMQTGDTEVSTLAHDFIDFRKYISKCRFNDCMHISEIGCAVRDAVENGDIEQSRYNSYVQIYNEIKDVREWERK